MSEDNKVSATGLKRSLESARASVQRVLKVDQDDSPVRVEFSDYFGQDGLQRLLRGDEAEVLRELAKAVENSDVHADDAVAWIREHRPDIDLTECHKKTITIKVSFFVDFDFEEAFGEATRLIREGYVTGGSRNDTGHYFFQVEDN